MSQTENKNDAFVAAHSYTVTQFAIINMKGVIAIVVLLFCNFLSKSQDRITNSPDSANIITSDIDNFWKAFDLLEKQKTHTDSLNIIKKLFIDNATEGLKEYMKAANSYEKEFLASIKNNRQEYVIVRSKTENIKNEKDEIIRDLRKLKQIYPDVKIPAICFSIGKFEVGGSQFKNTLFIGSEKDSKEDVDIAAQCIHEIIHFQQKTQETTSNLEGAMIEGAAEFMYFFVTGKRTIGATWSYGISNEKKPMERVLSNAGFIPFYELVFGNA